MTSTATAEATRTTVNVFLVARANADTENLTALFADEVDWLLAENPNLPSPLVKAALSFARLLPEPPVGHATDIAVTRPTDIG